MKAILAAISLVAAPALALIASGAHANSYSDPVGNVVGLKANAIVCTTDDATEQAWRIYHSPDSTQKLESFMNDTSNGCHRTSSETLVTIVQRDSHNNMLQVRYNDSGLMIWSAPWGIDNYIHRDSKGVYRDTQGYDLATINAHGGNLEPGTGYKPKIPAHVPTLPSNGVMSRYDVACLTEEEVKSAMSELNRGGVAALNAYMREHSPSCGTYPTGTIVKVQRMDGAYAQIHATGRYAARYPDGTKVIFDDVNAKPDLVQWTLAESINFGH